MDIETEQPIQYSSVENGAGHLCSSSEITVTDVKCMSTDSALREASSTPFVDLQGSNDSHLVGCESDVSKADLLICSAESKDITIKVDELAFIDGNGITLLDTSTITHDSQTSLADISNPISNSDKIATLATKIDKFDPMFILDRPSVINFSSIDDGFTGDINYGKLIDELVNDSGNVVNAKVLIEAGNIQNDSKIEVSTIDIAPGASKNIDNIIEKDLELSLSVCNAESVEGEQKSPSASMSASTESEGLQEESDMPVNESKSEPQQPELETRFNEENVHKITLETQKSENHSAMSSAKSSKNKRKEDKSIEHILKALSSLQTTEEKLAALCKKYADLHEEHRILQTSFKQNQRKLTVTTREKDQLQAEHTKAVMAKSKLESLCRELQKHNQTIRQESLQRAKEEDEKRKEISQKFQTTISEIQTQMQDNHERNKQLREENFELANKLKKFIEQYETREKQVEKVIQHRELEQKLADAKLEQASAILMEEKGRNQKEKELLILQTTEYIKKMQIKDAELQMYKERYDEFQSTIKKSEEMFGKFKSEMDKMSKRCKKLEKDGAQWRGKWENANRTLLTMAEEKAKYDKERSLLMTKISKLESLCRAMQAERQARKLLGERSGVQGNISKLGLGIDLDQLTKLTCDDSPTTDPTVQSHMQESSQPTAEEEQKPTEEEQNQDPLDDEDTNGLDVDRNQEENDEDNSDSGASEQMGITVIQQESTEALTSDVNQLQVINTEANQSESQQGISTQSENSSEQVVAAISQSLVTS